MSEELLWENPVFDGLSCRAMSACCNLGLMSRDKIAAAIMTDLLHPNNRALRNYGWKTHNEVLAWLGMPSRGPIGMKRCSQRGGEAQPPLGERIELYHYKPRNRGGIMLPEHAFSYVFCSHDCFVKWMRLALEDESL